VCDSDRVHKYSLECLRLAAECKNLAQGVPVPAVKAHYLRMAEMWLELAVSPPSK
jgi:hypothetical protein